MPEETCVTHKRDISAGTVKLASVRNSRLSIMAARYHSNFSPNGGFCLCVEISHDCRCVFSLDCSSIQGGRLECVGTMDDRRGQCLWSLGYARD